MAAFGAAVASSTAGEAQGQKPAGARTRPADEPFGDRLNTSTIRDKRLADRRGMEIAAVAASTRLEPWIPRARRLSL